ncbi:MAG: hypothetical protein J6F31_08565 [Oscillospiraceae bacterium]|nr:hypothetical protein [Oscillospiraceae bacterium]
MKRFIALLSALLMTVAALVFPVHVGAVGISFEDYFELEELMNTGNGKKEIQKIAPALAKDRFIFLPSVLTVFDITSIYVAEDMTSVHAKTDGNTVVFNMVYDEDFYERHVSEINTPAYADAVEMNYHGTDIVIFEEWLDEDVTCDYPSSQTTYMYSMWFKENGRYFYVSVTSNEELEDDYIADFSRYRRLTFGKGFVRRNGNITYIKKNDKTAKGWLTVGGRKYYFRKNGSMARGRLKIGGTVYSFNEHGECEGKYTGKKTVSEKKNSADEWGITLTAKNVTPTGMTMEVLWDGKTVKGEISFGEYYYLEKKNGSNWEQVPYIDEACFIEPEYMPSPGEIMTFEKNWKFFYGELDKGEYRLCTEFGLHSLNGDSERKMCYAYFSI